MGVGALLAVLSVAVGGCRSAYEEDEPWRGDPEESAKVDIRIVVTRNDGESADVLLIPSGRMPSEGYWLGVCYREDGGLPQYGKDQRGLGYPERENLFQVWYGDETKRIVVRAFARTDSYRTLYSEPLVLVPGSEAGMCAMPTAPEYRFSDDSAQVTFRASLVGIAPEGESGRGFCITRPSVAPDERTPRLQADRETFSLTVDTLRRGSRICRVGLFDG